MSWSDSQTSSRGSSRDPRTKNSAHIRIKTRSAYTTPISIIKAISPAVPIIAKDDFGLQWAEIGPLFRLPGYTSIEEFIVVSLALGSRGVAMDSLILFQAEFSQPGSGAMLVAIIQSFGLPVLTYTVNTERLRHNIDGA